MLPDSKESELGSNKEKDFPSARKNTVVVVVQCLCMEVRPHSSGNVDISEISWCQAGIDVYIPNHKYQANSHLSIWFSAACSADIVHTNQFFCLYHQNRSSESKVKFRLVVNCFKRVLEAAKLAYVNK